MNEEKIEQLAKRWPDLFEKSSHFEFSVGDGWYNIIDILCGLISQDVERAHSCLKYAKSSPDNKFNQSINDLEQQLLDAKTALPTIVQVKEKFGTLRFYINGSNDAVDNYIKFAERMSSCVCEECGDPGVTRAGRWVRTLCKEHHMKFSPEDYCVEGAPIRKTQPKLAEEQ